jgi:CysZ protein
MGDSDRSLRRMLRALLRAVADLAAPPLRRIIAASLMLTVLTVAALWAAAAIVLDHAARFGWQWLDWLIDLLGMAAAVALTWLLFPAVATMVMGFFLDRIAGVVESLDYPGRRPPRRASVAETIMTTLRLTGIAIILNILALPVYLLAPGVNFFVFIGLNGYLLGREYFEVVALRRLDPTTARALRARFAGRVFLGGVAITGMFAVPIVNLVAPVIATAFMVHLFEGVRSGPPASAS